MSQKETEKVSESMNQAAAEYTTNPDLMKWGYSNDTETFNWLWNKYVHKELDLDVNPINVRDVRIFRSGMKEFTKDLRKAGKTSWLAPFKIPAATMRKMPELQKFQDDLVREASFFRKYKVQNQQHSDLIIKHWGDLAAQVGGKASIKEFQRIESDLDAVSHKIETSKNPTQEQYLQREQLRLKYSEFLEGGANPVFKDFDQVMHGVDIETLEGYTPAQKAKWREIDTSVKKIRENGVKILSSALNKVIDTAKMLDQREGSFRKLEDTINLLKDEIKSIEFQSEIDKSGKRPSQADFKATSDLELFGFKKDEPLFLKKYMPHKLLGMVKAVRDANRIMLDGDKNKTQRELIEADWDNFRKSVESAKSRSLLNENVYFSRDPNFFFRAYTNEISQFNFQAHLENNYRRQINKLLELSEKSVNENDRQLEGATEAVMKQMRDVKASLVEIDPRSDTALANLSRLITSVQYFRLMGGNVRSAARNATQRMYEFVHFGFTAHGHARDYYKGASGTDNKAMAEREAERHGLLWYIDKGKSPLARATVRAEGTRGALAEGSDIPAGYKMDTNGVLRKSDATAIIKKASEGASVLAQKTGYLHRVVEDWNRKGTFEIAFALSHMNLKNSPDSWIAKQMKVDPSRAKEDGWEDMKSNWIQRRAGNIAYNAVTDLHFEYSKWAKAPGIRGPAGQVVGQFLHYRFSLFDLMSRWWKDGVKAMKAGDFNREEAWRLYRLGILQSMITGASVGMGLQITSLVNNDVISTADQLFTFMSADRDDPEEMKNLERKTYRQGALSFAGPFVGHAIQFAEWNNWLELDHNGMPQHPTQTIVETDADFTRKQRWKGRSLINSQLARTTTYTFPILVKQGILDALTLELGLFPKQELRDKRSAMGRLVREHIPADVRKLKQPLFPVGWALPDVTIAEGTTPRAIRAKRKGALAGPGKRWSPSVSPSDAAKVLGSLDYMRGESTPGEILREIRGG